MTSPIRVSLLLTVLSMPVLDASAQPLAQQTRRSAGAVVGPSHVISVNPFLPLFGYFAAEYEQRVTPAVALAISGSHVKLDHTRYTNIDAKMRLYPNETALKGFSIAASLGVGRIHETESTVDCAFIFPDSSIARDSLCPVAKPFTTGSFAIEVGYQWLLGPSKVTAVTVGGGAKRYLGSESKFDQLNRVIPTLRLSIGYAF